MFNFHSTPNSVSHLTTQHPQNIYSFLVLCCYFVWVRVDEQHPKHLSNRRTLSFILSPPPALNQRKSLPTTINMLKLIFYMSSRVSVVEWVSLLNSFASLLLLFVLFHLSPNLWYNFVIAVLGIHSALLPPSTICSVGIFSPSHWLLITVVCGVSRTQ